MKVQFIRTSDRRWYREGGVSSWGFGVTVQNFGELRDTGDDYEIVGDGWLIEVTLGIWGVFVYNEAGFRSIHGDDTRFYGTFSVMTP